MGWDRKFFLLSLYHAEFICSDNIGQVLENKIGKLEEQLECINNKLSCSNLLFEVIVLIYIKSCLNVLLTKKKFFSYIYLITTQPSKDLLRKPLKMSEPRN